MRKLYFSFVLIMFAAAIQAQRSPVAVNDVLSIGESRSALINVLSNDSNFNLGDTVCLTGVWGGYAGWATVQNCRQVLFHPLVPAFVGKDTFYYRACDTHQTSLCDTGRVIVTVTYLPPYHVNDTVTVIAGDTARVYVLANDTNFNPLDSIRLTTIWGAPAGWSWIVDSTEVVFRTPDSLYHGLQRIRYRSCDTYVPGLCDTGTLIVNVIRKPKAYIDSAVEIEPASALVSLLANDSIFNGLDSACITQIWGMHAAWASVLGCGHVSFQPPTYDFFGQDTLFYRSCYTRTPALCDTGMVVLHVVLPSPQVDFTYTEGPACVASIFNNSTLTDSLSWSVTFLTNNGTNFSVRDSNMITIAANMDSDFEVTVCLMGMNAGGDSTVCYTFWIQCQINTGINVMAQSDLKIFPDPATDRFIITRSEAKAAHYMMTDISGRYILSGETTGLSTAVFIADLLPGIYLLQVGAEDRHTYKIVKE